MAKEENGKYYMCKVCDKGVCLRALEPNEEVEDCVWNKDETADFRQISRAHFQKVKATITF